MALSCPLLMLWTAPPTGRASALESVADEGTRIRRSLSCWQSRPLVSTSRSRSFRFMGSHRPPLPHQIPARRSLKPIRRRRNILFATAHRECPQLLLPLARMRNRQRRRNYSATSTLGADALTPDAANDDTPVEHPEINGYAEGRADGLRSSSLHVRLLGSPFLMQPTGSYDEQLPQISLCNS